MKKLPVFFFLLLSYPAFHCAQTTDRSWPYWMGALQLNDSTILDVPFKFEKAKDNSAVFTFINGEEKIPAKEVIIKGDSIFIKMPVYDSEFKLRLSNGKMTGNWINHARKDKNVIAFTAEPDKREAGPMCGFCSHINGKWEATFNSDSSKAIGVFKGNADFSIEGTFMTETGDYRYLAGTMWKNKAGEIRFKLQCFDGAHAFLFDGALSDDGKIYGDFYSGAHHYETWSAFENPNAQLRDADEIIKVTSGSEKVNFTFPNIAGKNISLKNKKYKNKVVIIQIMGTWCPNCMDETKYLSEFYNNNKSKGLEVIALAFEKTENFKKAAENVKRLKNKFGVNYEMLITGKTGKEKAAQTFPMLSDINAFPTTIYIDKKGKIRKVYTGYYGPATGEEHEKFKKEHEEFINKLLAE